MKPDFYIRYNQDTLLADVLSGSEITDVPVGFAVAPVRHEDGLAFMNLEKKLHQYSISVVDGYVDFLPLWSVKQHKMPDNVVRDLGHYVIFFDNFGIRFDYTGSVLTLNLDLDLLIAGHRNSFNTYVADRNQFGHVYVTEFNDPTQLIEKYEISLGELKDNKKVSFKLTTDKKISVWIAKK